jgi:hypothetical protein
MRLWIIAALGILIAAAYVLFYVTSSLESQGANLFGLVNTIGLITVVLGIVAAGAVLRRSTRP